MCSSNPGKYRNLIKAWVDAKATADLIHEPIKDKFLVSQGAARHWVPAIVGIGAAVLAGFLFGRRAWQEKTNSSAPQELASQVEELRRQVHTLRAADNGRREAGYRALRAAEDRLGSAEKLQAPEGATSAQPPLQELEDFHVQASKLRDVLETKLNTEPSESARTEELRSRLLQLLEHFSRTEPSLREVRLDSASCGQTICRFRLLHRNVDSITEALPLLRQDPLFHGGYHFKRDKLSDDSHSTTVYLARPGEELPSH